MPIGNKQAGSRGSLNPAFDRRIKIHVGEIPIVIDSGKMAVYNGAGCFGCEKVPWWVVDDMFSYLMDEQRKAAWKYPYRRRVVHWGRTIDDGITASLSFFTECIGERRKHTAMGKGQTVHDALQNALSAMCNACMDSHI